MKKLYVILQELRWLIYFCFVVFLSGLLLGCSAADNKSGFIIPGDRDGLPMSTEGEYLRPGLETIYLFSKYRHVKDMHVSESGIAKFGKKGQPILFLDHRFADGEVFASGRSKGVGVLMKGYFNLETPGFYQFRARSI